MEDSQKVLSSEMLDIVQFDHPYSKHALTNLPQTVNVTRVPEERNVSQLNKEIMIPGSDVGNIFILGLDNNTVLVDKTDNNSTPECITLVIENDSPISTSPIAKGIDNSRSSSKTNGQKKNPGNSGVFGTKHVNLNEGNNFDLEKLLQHNAVKMNNSLLDGIISEANIVHPHPTIKTEDNNLDSEDDVVFVSSFKQTATPNHSSENKLSKRLSKEESTLRNELDLRLISYPQYVMCTPGLSNPEDLKSSLSDNLKVISLDSNATKKKRVIFLSNNYCLQCKETICLCSKKNKVGGMCEKCGKVGLINVRRHLARCEPDFTKKRNTIKVCHKCTKCNREFSSTGRYLIHVKRTADAPVCNYYRCNICYEKFSKQGFKEHITEHPNFVCSKCGYSFLTSRNRLLHEKICNTHRVPEEIVCQFCGKLVLATRLRHHYITHTQEKNVTCDICQRKYYTQAQLKKHAKVAHSEKSFVCDICQKKFAHATALKSHVSVVHLKKPIAICEFCGAEFARRDYHRIHLRIHHSGKTRRVGSSRRTRKSRTTICCYCKKVCKDHATLNVHFKRHFAKRLKCKFCPLTFAHQGNRARHENLHEHPCYDFGCKICFARHNSLDELRRHLDKSHSKMPKVVYDCQYCSESYSRKYLLLHHIGVVHPERVIEEEKMSILMQYENLNCDATF